MNRRGKSLPIVFGLTLVAFWLVQVQLVQVGIVFLSTESAASLVEWYAARHGGQVGSGFVGPTDRWPPVVAAASLNRGDVVIELIRRGHNPNACSRLGSNDLNSLASHDDWKNVYAAIRLGADPLHACGHTKNLSLIHVFAYRPYDQTQFDRLSSIIDASGKGIRMHDLAPYISHWPCRSRQLLGDHIDNRNVGCGHD
jgi:hypothetical protein